VPNGRRFAAAFSSWCGLDRSRPLGANHGTDPFQSCPAKREGGPPAGRWKGMGGNASRMAAGPLHHASYGPPPPRRFTARVRINNTVLATRSCARALPTTKPIDSPPAPRGRRSAERRMPTMGRAASTNVAVCRCLGRGCAPRRQVYAVCALICLRGAPAFRRFDRGSRRDSHPCSVSRPCFLGLGIRRALPALSCPSPVTAPHASAVVPKGMMPKAAPARVASPRGSTALAPHFRSHPECVPR